MGRGVIIDGRSNGLRHHTTAFFWCLLVTVRGAAVPFRQAQWSMQYTQCARGTSGDVVVVSSHSFLRPKQTSEAITLFVPLLPSRIIPFTFPQTPSFFESRAARKPFRKHRRQKFLSFIVLFLPFSKKNVNRPSNSISPSTALFSSVSFVIHKNRTELFLVSPLRTTASVSASAVPSLFRSSRALSLYPRPFIASSPIL